MLSVFIDAHRAVPAANHAAAEKRSAYFTTYLVCGTAYHL
jgi:hypothetical protein